MADNKKPTVRMSEQEIWQFVEEGHTGILTTLRHQLNRNRRFQPGGGSRIDNSHGWIGGKCLGSRQGPNRTRETRMPPNPPSR